MTDSEQRFSLSARPPVRALAIAAVTALVGAGLGVAARALGLGNVVAAIGLVLLGLGVALGVAALVLEARSRTTLVLDADAISVLRGRDVHRLPWADIDTVTLTGPRLTLVPKSGTDVPVLNPRTPDDPTFAALLAAISRRLDADRGYRTGPAG